jgi:hypothetical protein
MFASPNFSDILVTNLSIVAVNVYGGFIDTIKNNPFLFLFHIHKLQDDEKKR